MKIGDQIIEVIIRHQNLDKEAAFNKAVEMMAQVGIPSPEKRMKDYPHQFSGGMRQRVMIAMALACNPSLSDCGRADYCTGRYYTGTDH